jgi:two-component system chemotaxis response regulator CheB
MGGIKILIADSSSVYKKMFMQAATEENSDAVVTCVATGDEALEKIKRNDYDVIIIDAEITGTGEGEPDILRAINRQIPKALILVTARPSNANDRLYADAMAKGAVDCMTKPLYDSYRENIDIIKRKLADIFKISDGNNNKIENSGSKIAPESAKIKKQIKKNRFQPEIVLIAASTGGPLALEKILTKLNGDFPVPILVVQHMPSHFTTTLAQNLNNKSLLNVKVGENRETISAGTVYIAPGGMHMKIDSKYRIYMDGSPPLNGVRPAADALFESVAESFDGTRVLAVILTGMGRDGEKGLSMLKEKLECFCLVQSEETCVVYGMPQAAVESGFADKILDLDEIPRELESFQYAPVQNKS